MTFVFASGQSINLDRNSGHLVFLIFTIIFPHLKTQPTILNRRMLIVPCTGSNVYGSVSVSHLQIQGCVQTGSFSWVHTLDGQLVLWGMIQSRNLTNIVFIINEDCEGHCGASSSPDHIRAWTPTGTRVRIRPAVISRSHSPPLLSISFPVQTFTVLSE